MTALTPRSEMRANIVFVAVVLVYSMCVSLIARGLIPKLEIVADPTWGMDYRVYLRAAKEIWTEVLYENRPILPFRYPPMAAILFLPMRLVSETIGHDVLNTLSVAATVASTYRVLGFYRVGSLSTRRVLALACASILVLGTPWRTELALGQINSILLACVIIVVTHRQDSLRWGALLGIPIAIKLAAGVVVPGLLLLHRPRMTIGAIVAFAVSVLIGFIVMGQNARTFWFETFLRMSGGRPRSEIFSQNLSGALPRFGSVGGVGLTVFLCWFVLLALTGLGLIIAVRQHDLVKVTLVLGIAGLLGQPVTWTHHWVWLGPAGIIFAIAISRGRRAWPWVLSLAAVVLTIGFPVGYAMPDHSLSGMGLPVWQALIASTYVLVGFALLVLIPLAPIRPTEGRADTLVHDAIANPRTLAGK